jgi:DNA-binding NarL/FixJ family response regulator
MFGAAQALREVAGHQEAPRGTALRDPYLEAARSKLAVAAWDAAFAEGRAMTLGEAAEYALNREKPAESVPASPYPGGLSAREAEVLRLVARGLTNARVAQELYISPRTVDRHLNSVYRKLGVSSRTAAARLAMESGVT